MGTTGMTTSAGQFGPRKLGPYELVCEIGKSQLGALWAGGGEPGEVLVRRIARKAPVDDAMIERIAEAARWAIGAPCEGVASVLDVVVVDEEVGIVSQYVEGEPLRTLLRQSGFRRTAIPPPAAARIAVDVLEALAAAEVFERHAPGSAWPDSVIAGTDGRARLFDFGLAGVVLSDPAWSAQPDLISYAAPERAEGKPVDARADVFTVGVLLWEMLANQRLFPGITRAAVTLKLLSGPILRLDAPKLSTSVGAPLADIVERALQREPDARYAEPREMLNALLALGSDALAAPAEVGPLIEQLAAGALPLRRRALEKAMQRSSSPIASALPARPPRRPAEGTLLGVAPPSVPMGRDRPPSPPAPPARARGSGATLLGVAPGALPPAPGRLPLPPPPPPRERGAPWIAAAPDQDAADLASFSSQARSAREHDELESLLEASAPPALGNDTHALENLLHAGQGAGPLAGAGDAGTSSGADSHDSISDLLEDAEKVEPAAARPPIPFGPAALAQAPPSAMLAPAVDASPASDRAGLDELLALASQPPHGASVPDLADEPRRPFRFEIPKLDRNRRIVLGVVAAMALLFSVALVVGQVRDKNKEEEESKAPAAVSASTAAKTAPARPSAKAKSATAARAAVPAPKSPPPSKPAAPAPKTEGLSAKHGLVAPPSGARAAKAGTSATFSARTAKGASKPAKKKLLPKKKKPARKKKAAVKKKKPAKPRKKVAKKTR